MKRCLLLFLFVACGRLGAERWAVQYFYDENKSSLSIADMASPTPRRGVAVGAIQEGSHTRGAAVVTSDGGEHWSLVPLDAPGLSVFFLDDSHGWVVTPRGILQTGEGGRTWRKLASSPKDVLRVWFFDPQHGYAVGFKKSIWETTDGGKRWTRIPASDLVKSTPEFSVYSNIAFLGKAGLIVGNSRPPRPDESPVPDWMDPEHAGRRRERPSTLISLATSDGGAHWDPAMVSMFGEVTRVRLAPDSTALTLIKYQHDFSYPSEVYMLRWKGRGGQGIYRNPARDVTDLVAPAADLAFLAAVELPGKGMRLPVPGRLHVLKSVDLKNWSEMELDYRATAGHAAMTAADATNIWLGTDTGMILKLVP